MEPVERLRRQRKASKEEEIRTNMDPQIGSNKQIDGCFNKWTIPKTTHQTKQRKKSSKLIKLEMNREALQHTST